MQFSLLGPSTPTVHLSNDLLTGYLAKLLYTGCITEVCVAMLLL